MGRMEDNYSIAGSGMIIRPENIDRVAGRKARMNMLVEMDRRHTEMLNAGDWIGLLALAAEYHALGAVGRAAQIRKEAA